LPLVVPLHRLRLPSVRGRANHLAADRTPGEGTLNEKKLSLGSRLLIGGIAGFVGTLAMTSAMARGHRRLPEKEQYPLTPREIVESTAEQVGLDLENEAAKDATIAAHFAYGAACGALIAAASPRISETKGAAAGVGVWMASYLGWIPGVGILKPATEHPLRRNMLMIGCHLVWGATTARAMRELTLARESMIEAGPDKDAPAEVEASSRASV
jgi:uncharacterized membrane protein YagU involved in acid resistance